MRSPIAAINALRWRLRRVQALSIPGERLRPGVRVIEPLGYIDECSRGEVRGWAIDKARPNEYVTVCVLVNGSFVGKVCGYQYRGDIKARFGTLGLCGFGCALPAWARDQRELLIEVRLEDGRHIGHSPYQFKRDESDGLWPIRDREDASPCILFLHIPKCAGTTVRRLVEANMLLSEYVLLYPDLPGIPPEDILHLSETQLGQLRCVFGHFAFGLHQALLQPARYVTIMREPVGRVYSHYFHFARNEPKHLAPYDMPLEELFRHPPLAEFDNLMVRLLAGVDENETPPGSVDESIYDRAIDNLEKHFAFVGLQERMPETRERLMRFEPFQNGNLGRENPGDGSANTCKKPALLDAIRDANRFDVRLYDYVVSRFWAVGKGSGS